MDKLKEAGNSSTSKGNQYSKVTTHYTTIYRLFPCVWQIRKFEDVYVIAFN
jgi:hypothetical protein